MYGISGIDKNVPYGMGFWRLGKFAQRRQCASTKVHQQA
jgi:hypothetical protein